MLCGDRSRGLARAQHTKMEKLKWKYNLEFDTTNTNSFANAKKILDFVNKS